MTNLWAKVPLWILLDGGVRSLPPAAQLALVFIAATDGFTRCGPTAEDAVGALNALVDGAGESLPHMIARGVVERSGEVLRLVSPTEPCDTSTNEEQPAETPTPGETHRRPSQSPLEQRRRKVRSWFNHRTGPCREVSKTATWELWSVSPEGVAMLAVGRQRHRGNTPTGTRERGVLVCGNTPGTHRERTGNTLPSDSPLSVEEPKKEERSAGSARDREHTGNTPTGTQEHRVPANECVPDGVGGFKLSDAEEVLHTIRSLSGGRFSTRLAHAQLQRFHFLCCELFDRGTTRTEVERIGDHIRHGGLSWVKSPDVGSLIAEGKDLRGPQLPRILADIDGCPSCSPGSALAADALVEADPWSAGLAVARRLGKVVE